MPIPFQSVAKGQEYTRTPKGSPVLDEAKQWDGWGTALKPAQEPILLARKPLIGAVAANVLKHGTGAINIDGCRVPAAQAQALGRWPANVIHDGSEEVVAAFPESDGATSNGKSGVNEIYGGGWGRQPQEPGYADSGSASRFFYTAKADANDRIGSKHPTVKPVDLMQWLVRLVTPKGGIVLDPFAGTGTTAEAAFREGMRCVAIEREDEYQADIRRRMALVMAGPDERARESIKARNGGQPTDAGPLFAGSETPPAWEGKYTESSRTNKRAGGIEVVK